MRPRLLRVMAPLAMVMLLGALTPIAPSERQSAAPRPETAAPSEFVPPRTPDGRPDLEGNWNGGRGAIFIDGHLGDRPRPNASASMVVDPPDGKIPYKTWALAKREEHWYEFIDPFAACTSMGAVRQMSGTPRGFQILQTPTRIVIISEWGHVFRVIPTDGSPHLPAGIRLFMGDSRGRWEGDTLVVDTTNFNGKTWLAVAGDFHSDALHTLERFTLVDTNRIRYEATLTDPTVYTRPWTIAFDLRRFDTGNETWEEECHGGNIDFPHLRNLYKGFFGLPEK